MDRDFEEFQGRETWIFYASATACLLFLGFFSVITRPGGWFWALLAWAWAAFQARAAMQAYSSRGKLLFVVRCRGSKVSWEARGTVVVVDLSQTQQIGLWQSESGESLEFVTRSGSERLQLVPFYQCEALFAYLGEHFTGRLRKDGKLVREAIPCAKGEP